MAAGPITPAASPATTAAPTTVAAPVVDSTATAAQTALNALRSGAIGSYNAALAQLASGLSGRVGVSPAALQSAWQGASKDGMIAMLAALTQLGVAYSFDAETPQVGFDCSGLASWAWSQVGVDLPHQSMMIINQIKPETLATVRPGDMLYYPGHVMISLGVGDAIVHAAGTGRGVIASALNGRHSTDLRVGDPTPAT